MRKIVLIDGSSLAFRAFFSILNIDNFKNRAGLHTNALYSFNRMLDQVLAQFDPSHILVAFDKSDVTFRTEKYADYKGGRQKTPSEFKEQMPYFSVLLDAYGIPHYRVQGYEADDIIGTLARQADPSDEVIVISGDKDLTQLAADNVTVYITRKGVSDLKAYTVDSIRDEMGITPEQIIDLKGLMGDSSDNYPGITRIGEKTGLKLLHQFGSVEAMYDRLDELKPSKMKENIINDKANALMSKDLARILTTAPIEVSIESIERKAKDIPALLTFYQQMEFNSFIKDLQNQEDFEEAIEQEHAFDLPDYQIEVLDQIQASHLPSETCLFFEILEENYHDAKIQGIAWTDAAHEKVYIASAEVAFTNPLFKQWLADESVLKRSFDSKKDQVLAARFGDGLKGVQFDVLIASYLVDTHNSQELADMLRVLDLPQWVRYDEAVYGKGAKRGLPDDLESFHQHLATKVLAMPTLEARLLEQLGTSQMLELYREIELPLASVLASMEISGIKVDGQILEEKNQALIKRLAAMEAEIYQVAGLEFNINSPKQLGEILFDTLKLPVIKKTKTGYSTAADVLEKLVHAHPVVPLILDYRQMSKLQSTYLGSLPAYIHEDGRIHTRFVQTLTQTGRLSSTDPNLQNIPIRIEEGKQIRQAFVPTYDDWQLFGADYSQIELRVLAHICDDEHMKAAFIEGEDIHDATARRVFGLADDETVDSNMRRNAKAVNFGIVYGISDYGLSQNLNITRKDAKEFIDTYFAKFPGVRNYMDVIVEKAREEGYVSTLFNRRRYLPDIKASNFNVRSFAERTAMNSPIQGTAADIIKIAMVKLQEEIHARGLQSRLLLQVHDELILEGPSEEMEILAELVPAVMEGAVELSVPLRVDIEQGNTWYEI